MDNISGLCSYTQKNPERSRMCAGCDKNEIGCTRASAAQTHSTFSKSVTVAMGVSKLRRMDMIFIDAKVKISVAYYREVLLTRKLQVCHA